MQHLLGLASLDPPLCVADVQVLWVLRVEVSHNVHPSEEQSMKCAQEAPPAAERQPPKRRPALTFCSGWPDASYWVLQSGSSVPSRWWGEEPCRPHVTNHHVLIEVQLLASRWKLQYIYIYV